MGIDWRRSSRLVKTPFLKERRGIDYWVGVKCVAFCDVGGRLLRVHGL